MKNILFVNHKKEKCGVYQFGKNTFDVLQNSKLYNFSYIEIENCKQYLDYLSLWTPDLIIYNYHNQTLPWLNEEIMHNILIKQIAIAGHDCFADFPSLILQIIPDPTINETDKIKKVGRLVLDFIPTQSVIPNSIGSFGFGFIGKYWEKIVQLINQQYDTGILRLHIPYSDFADAQGYTANSIATTCRSLLKPEIDIEISHIFFTTEELLNWLSQNEINLFTYPEMNGRGISSTIDFALAARRPMGITKSNMFRHIYYKNEILLEKNLIKDIIIQGTIPLQEFYKEWSPQNLLNDYEKIISEII